MMERLNDWGGATVRREFIHHLLYAGRLFDYWLRVFYALDVFFGELGNDCVCVSQTWHLSNDSFSWVRFDQTFDMTLMSWTWRHRTKRNVFYWISRHSSTLKIFVENLSQSQISIKAIVISNSLSTLQSERFSNQPPLHFKRCPPNYLAFKLNSESSKILVGENPKQNFAVLDRRPNLPLIKYFS